VRDPHPTAHDIVRVINDMITEGSVEFNVARGRLVFATVPGRPALFIGDQRAIRARVMANDFSAPTCHAMRNAIDAMERAFRAENPIRISTPAQANARCSSAL
jgi:acetyl-CoA carboxylase alpha subunit